MWGNIVNYINLIGCMVAFLLAIFIESLMIPRVLLIAKKKRLFDIPDYRKIHSNPIPRLAGTTFAPAIILSILPVICLFTLLFPDHTSSSLTLTISCLICGLVILVMTGIKDDLIGVQYSHKFVLQLIAAVFLVSSGNWINNFYGILGIHEIPIYLGIAFTLLLTLSIINAINLIDGVDGLAGTLIAIAAFILGIGLYIKGAFFYAWVAFSVTGVIIPFLWYNFSFRKKIFMGDTGSLTLGFVLSFLATHFCMLTPGDSPDNVLPVVIAASVLFVPLFDTIRVFGVRFVQRKPIFYPDKNHIHHKLLGLGCSHKQVCMILGGISLGHILMNIALYYVLNVNVLLAINVLLGIVENVFLNYKRIQLERSSLEDTRSVAPSEGTRSIASSGGIRYFVPSGGKEEKRD